MTGLVPGAVESQTHSAARSDRSGGQAWFFGPLPDLLLGAGGLYLAAFALQALAGPTMREAAPLSWMPLIALILGGPHYGATLLRVYQQRSDRRKYAVFSVYATIALALAYAVGIYHVGFGSALVTLYLTWSPWHYSGQNYGIALLFLRRRGIAIDAAVKRPLYASFGLSYALVFVAIHGASVSTGAQDYAPANYQGTVFHFMSLGIPARAQLWLLGLLSFAYLASAFMACWALVGRAPLRDLFPAAVVMLTQALWFSLPTAAVQLGWLQGIDPLDHQHRAYAFMWVACGHFAQYLWITSYYAAASSEPSGSIRYLGRALLVGSAIWVFPTLIFAPELLGRLPFDAGLALLTAAVVNLHHFVLDGAIWKLRDGRVARVLLRQRHDAASGREAAPSQGSRLGFRLTSGIGAFCLLVSLGLKLDLLRTQRAFAMGDRERARSGLDRRAWLGRDSPRLRLELARLDLAASDLGAARTEAEHSRTLLPSVEAQELLARIYAAAGEHDAAGRALRAARELDPNERR